jgi:hypothetical protein
MTWKDKLEIGIKEDAPFRRDNLPPSQQDPNGRETKQNDETRSPEEPGARDAARVGAKVAKRKTENADRRQRPGRRTH